MKTVIDIGDSNGPLYNALFEDLPLMSKGTKLILPGSGNTRAIVVEVTVDLAVLRQYVFAQVEK